MFRKILSALKKCFWAICICALLITAGLIFHWFYVLAAGVIVAISSIAFIMEELKHGNVEEGAFSLVGCSITILFAIAALFFHEKRYISPYGHKQHIYSDCRYIIEKSSIKEVTELEGFFYLTFSDCKICKERKKAEIEEDKAAKKQQERDELRGYLNDLIDSLDNGADPGDIKLQLHEDWELEEKGDDVRQYSPPTHRKKS